MRRYDRPDRVAIPAVRHDILTFSVRVVDSLASRNHGTRYERWMRTEIAACPQMRADWLE